MHRDLPPLVCSAKNPNNFVSLFNEIFLAKYIISKHGCFYKGPGLTSIVLLTICARSNCANRFIIYVKYLVADFYLTKSCEEDSADL